VKGLRIVRNIKITVCHAAIFFVTCTWGYSQSVAAIQQDLASKYVLTQPTAALDDIVTPGSVLTLKKGRIVMAPVSSTNVCQNTYKDGKLTQNFLCKGLTRPFPGPSLPAGMATRTFVPGEKLWLTKIDVRDDAVILGLFTDAIKDATGADVRYKADLKFVFPKGVQLTADQVESLIAEVFSVQAADPAGAPTQQAAPPVAPPPAGPVQPPPPIIVSLGQSPDQVTSEVGQPDHINKVGAKQVYVYKDMKVTFLHGKVTDIQ
jgi:hypothetical protein